MRGYDAQLSKMDAVSRFFALRGRARAEELLERDEEVRALAQGRGRRGQEVWVLTDRSLVRIRVGLLTRESEVLGREELGGAEVRTGRLFATLRVGPWTLRHTQRVAAEEFRCALER